MGATSAVKAGVVLVEVVVEAERACGDRRHRELRLTDAGSNPYAAASSSNTLSESSDSISSSPKSRPGLATLEEDEKEGPSRVQVA